MAALKLPRPKTPPQPYEVEWLDAAVYPGEPHVSGMATMLTVGYFYYRDRKLIKLSSDLDGGEPRTIHTIPRVHLVRMTPLAPEKT